MDRNPLFNMDDATILRLVMEPQARPQQMDPTAVPGYGGGMIPTQNPQEELRRRALQSVLGGAAVNQQPANVWPEWGGSPRPMFEDTPEFLELLRRNRGR